MSEDAPDLVQFVGGPLHGKCRWVTGTPQLIEQHLPTGHLAVYRLRPTPMGVDWGARIYAPIGMSESVFLDQFVSLPRPVATNGALD